MDLASLGSAVSTAFFCDRGDAIDFMVDLGNKRNEDFSSNDENITSPTKKPKYNELDIVVTPPKPTSGKRLFQNSSDDKDNGPTEKVVIKQEKIEPTSIDATLKSSTSVKSLVSPESTTSNENPYNQLSSWAQRYNKRTSTPSSQESKTPIKNISGQSKNGKKSIDDVLKSTTLNQIKGSKNDSLTRLRIPDGTFVFYTFPSLPASKDGNKVFAMHIHGKSVHSTHWLFKGENVLASMKRIVTLMKDPEINPNSDDYAKFYPVMEKAFYASIRKNEYSSNNAESGIDTKNVGFQCFHVLCFVSDDIEHSMTKIIEVLKCETFYETYKMLFTGNIVSYLDKDQLTNHLKNADIGNAMKIKLDALNGLFVDNDIKNVLSALYLSLIHI